MCAAISLCAQTCGEFAGELGRDVPETTPPRDAAESDVDLAPVVARSRVRRGRPSSGERVPTPGGSSTPDPANMPGFADEAREHGGHADAVPRRSTRSAPAKPRRPNFVAL